MKHFLRHLFTPHESNNHRSKLLHHDSLLVLIFAIFATSMITSSVHQNFPQVLGIASSISPEQLVTLTNQQRQIHGLQPLKLDSELSQAATQKAADMFAKNYWAHISPDGVTPWVFIKNSGYDYLYAGENLARGFTSANDVVTAWMNSPSHRENMLSANYNDVGFAVADGNLTGSSTTLVVEEFGSRYIPSDQADTGKVIATYDKPATVAGTLQTTPAITVPQGTLLIQPQSKDVAALQNQPLVDSKQLNQRIAIGIIILLITVLVIDAIVIERKKIARLVAHNLDHIIYLVIILLLVIILGKGIIL
jgi:hypothetical protein